MKPITREEMYLAAAAGYDVTPPEPVTRKEMFLAKLAGMEVETPAVFTRQERLLEEAAARAPSVTINNQDITVTENGQYTADEGYTGLGTVTVEVPDEPAVLEDLKVTKNGNYTPSDGVDGFGSVSVNVPDIPATIQPLEITGNGTYTAPDGVDGYSPVTVNVPTPEIKLQDKTITENGTYTADSGYDGLGSVTVNVKGGGGLPAGVYWEALDLPSPKATGFVLAELNGDVYALANSDTASDTGIYYFYKLVNGAWELVLGENSFIQVRADYCYPVEFNGKLHITGNERNFHKAFDGAEITTYATLPKSIAGAALFVQNSKLKAYSYSDKNVYVWNESTDTWTSEATLSPANKYMAFFNIDGTIYAVDSSFFYDSYIKTYADGKLTQVCPIVPKGVGDYTTCFALGGAIYMYKTNGTAKPVDLYRYDTKTNKFEKIGSCPAGADHSESMCAYQNRLAFTPTYKMTYAPIMVMHEVTE